MLQNFRDKLTGMTAAIVVGILAIPFAFFGIDSFFLSGPSVEQVASVNGEKITEFEVEQGIALRRQQIANQFEGIDLALLGDEQLRTPVIEALVREAVLFQQAHGQGMAVSDELFRDVIISQEAFKRDGRFDANIYQYAIGRLGYTPKTYRERVEQELLVNQLMSGIYVSSFTSPLEFETFLKLSLEERDFHYLTIPLASFDDVVEIEEQEVTAYYQEQGAQFDEPEKISIEYIRLDPGSLIDKAVVTDEQIRAQFDVEAASADDTTRWHIAHIQLDEQADGSEQTRIDEIRARLDAGEDFAELAKAYSQDAGSAQQGGDLGDFSPGSLPEYFERALETLEPGEVSDVVTGDSALHLIRLVAKTEGQKPVFEEQRERISEELASAAVIDMMPRYVEELKEKTYNADSLESAATEMGLEMGISESFSRSGGAGISSDPRVVETAFGEDVLEHGFASEVMELQDQQYLVIKLKERIAAHRKPLDEVRDTIAATLKARKVQEMALAKSRELQDKLKAGATIEALAVEADLPWQVVTNATRFEAPADPRLLAAVFTQPSGAALPAIGETASSTGDLMVYSLGRIREGDSAQLSEDERVGLGRSLEQLVVSREWRAYEEALLGHAKIKR